MADTNADIHCNIIQCRKPLSLETQACVTSCSHIFCTQCANRCFKMALVCPACNTSLTQSDDIVLTQLNPSEEYKSSVLAGLRPDTIMDICSRAISFYYYQLSQELCYRAMFQQHLERKCNALQEQLQNAVRDGERAIKAEKHRYNVLAQDLEQDKRRIHDLQSQLHEKSKQFQKLHLMYEKLKRKALPPSIQQQMRQQQQQLGQSMNQSPQYLATPSIQHTTYTSASNIHHGPPTIFQPPTTMSLHPQPGPEPFNAHSRTGNPPVKFQHDNRLYTAPQQYPPSTPALQRMSHMPSPNSRQRIHPTTGHNSSVRIPRGSVTAATRNQDHRGGATSYRMEPHHPPTPMPRSVAAAFPHSPSTMIRNLEPRQGTPVPFETRR